MIDQLNLFEHWNFNSRSLPGERSERWYLCAASLQFQFTLPAWEAIWPINLSLFSSDNFNSRSLRRSDGCRGIYIIGNHKFQFSFPTWGAIVFVTLHLLIIQNFNSRFLRGSDIYSNSAASKAFYFNSRSPHGERFG